MKKLIAAALVCLMMLSCIALAELPDLTAYSDADLAKLADAVAAEQAARASGSQETAAQSAGGYETYEKGSKGDGVKALQQRLIELNYLSGSADGDFGGKTKSAVEIFQKAAGLSVNGIADEETQKALFASDAPKAKVYGKMNFKDISRDPDQYEGELYTFSGKVLQVLEDDNGDGTTGVDMRIATKGNYDDVVYVYYIRSAGESRILEDDRVNVNAECRGLYSYTSTMGAEITLPLFYADSVMLK